MMCGHPYDVWMHSPKMPHRFACDIAECCSECGIILLILATSFIYSYVHSICAENGKSVTLLIRLTVFNMHNRIIIGLKSVLSMIDYL